MGALFICRIQLSGGLLRYQLKNLSIGISMTILTTPYILHLSQLCCFLTFHFSPKKLQSYFWCHYNAVSRLPKLKSQKKCKNQTNLVRISTTTQTASHVFFTVCEFFGWEEALALSLVSIYTVNCIFWGELQRKRMPPDKFSLLPFNTTISLKMQ